MGMPRESINEVQLTVKALESWDQRQDPVLVHMCMFLSYWLTVFIIKVRSLGSYLKLTQFKIWYVAALFSFNQHLILFHSYSYIFLLNILLSRF